VGWELGVAGEVGVVFKVREAGVVEELSSISRSVG
jgi:hypothetical protein